MNRTHDSLRVADVSVVIPMFNSGHSAVAAIRSVLAQTIGVATIIVVDDGSSDNSADIISALFSNNMPPVKLFRTPNGGAAHARNFGINQAKSSFIAFLDSDDTWLPEKLSKQLVVFDENDSIGMVGSKTTMGAKSISATSAENAQGRKYVSLTHQLFKNHFQTSTVIVRKHLIDQVGNFPADQRYAEEGDFFNRIAAHSTCVLLEHVLVDYSSGKNGFGESGLSANLLAMECGELRNIRRAYKRGDCGFMLQTAALSFSLIKFTRRLLIKALRRHNQIT